MSDFKTIRELLEANLPLATIDDIGLVISTKDDTAEATILVADVTAEINRYLAAFTPGPCPGCAAQLGGILGSFQWGLCTGEGACSRCGYPARGQHTCKTFSGSFVLAYHPTIVIAYTGSSDFEEEKNNPMDSRLHGRAEDREHVGTAAESRRLERHIAETGDY